MAKHVPGMLTCEEVDGFLYDFYEGQLSATERFKFNLHLSMCKECMDYVEQYKNTIRISQAGFAKIDSTEKVPEELIASILQSRMEK